jgi:hypothetical protein
MVYLFGFSLFCFSAVKIKHTSKAETSETGFGFLLTGPSEWKLVGIYVPTRSRFKSVIR